MEAMGLNINFWKDKNVLITGHTGFKGSWLTLWLNSMGANVTGLSLDESVSEPDLFSAINLSDAINDCKGNIIDYKFCSKLVQEINPEIVFHLAAQPLVRLSYSQPLTTFATNVLGTANILESLRNCNSVKCIVVITTDKCYENQEKDYEYVETDHLGGYDPYSSSKACAEHVSSAYFRSFFKEKKVGLATARAGNVIGGGDWASDRLIPDAIKAWSKNKKLIIRNPYSVRPWQHVLEPLFGYILLAQSLINDPIKYSQAWNFGPDKISCVSVKDAINLASKKWEKGAEWNENIIGTAFHEAKLLQLNSDKSKRLLNWYPKLDFDTSIDYTICWYKEYYKKNIDMKQLALDQISKYQNKTIYTKSK